MTEKTFLSPWTPAYWRTAGAEVRNLRILIFAALMMALRIVLGMFPIPVGENLRLLFKFIPDCIGAVIYGPVVAVFMGGLGDIIGYAVYPSGAFFPGYTLSAILGCFVFAIFLYRRRITCLRLFLSRLVINLFVNVGLGSLWSYILFGKGYFYYATKSVIKNAIMLPIETIILIALLAVLVPILTRLKLIPRQEKIYRL